MNQSVLCIGGINLDRKLKLTEKLRMGSSNPVTSHINSGGVARNVAENLARLNCDVYLLSSFADDSEGDCLLEKLEQLGINSNLSLISSDKSSGSYTSVHDPRGEMLLALAEMEMSESMPVLHVERVWPSCPRPAAVFLDTNFPSEVLEWVIRRCEAENLLLHIDPVSATKSRKLPHDLRSVDTIQPNLGELETMCGDVELKSDEELTNGCMKLLERGVKNIILSLSSGGVLWVNHQSRIQFQADRIQVTDVTGAGDALSAGVLWGRLRGLTMKHACRIGMFMAEKTLQSKNSVWPELCVESLETLLNQNLDS